MKYTQQLLLILVCILFGLKIQAQSFEVLMPSAEQAKEKKIKSIKAVLSIEEELYQDFDGSTIYEANYRSDGQVKNSKLIILDEDVQVMRSTYFFYGERGEMTKQEIIEHPVGEESEVSSYHFEYAYDKDGVLISTDKYDGKDLLQQTKHFYNEDGLLTKDISSSPNERAYSSNFEEVYEYDEKGQLKTRTRIQKNGKVSSYSYSPDGKIVTSQMGDRRMTFVVDQITGSMLMNTYIDGDLVSSSAVESGYPERTERENGLTKKVYWGGDVPKVWTVEYQLF